MFKIIHTSDWHLGQHFFTKQRKSEHEAFLTWLAKQAQQLEASAIIVAGDIFDTSTPPSYARELYNQFVLDIQTLNCQLILLAGNHDSVSVLNESKSLLRRLNAQVITQPRPDTDEQLLTLTDKQGKPAALLAAIPFIRPADITQSQSGQSGVEKRQQLGEAIRKHYQQLYQQAQNKRTELGKNLPIIMTGHLAAVGVSQSESVRDIYIGTLDGFATSHFPEADYIALGHIHRAQCLNAKDKSSIYYSGSPIPLSFDELNQAKTVNLVTFNNNTLDSVELLPIPTFQQMQLIKGNLIDIEKQIRALPKDLSIWLSVQVETQEFLSDLQERIQLMTKDTQIQVLQLTRKRSRQETLKAEQPSESLTELTPMQVFERRLDMEDFSEATQQARLPRLRQLFSSIEHEIVTESTEAQQVEKDA